MSSSSLIPPAEESHAPKPPRPKNRRRRRWILKVFLGLCLVGLVLAMVGAVVVYLYAKPRYELAHSFELDAIDDLEVASLILDRHGVEIGRIFVQNRQPIGIEGVPKHFIDALLAAEDARYYEHDGVDYIGILRAVFLNIQAGEITQGASTITQQLARNAFDLKEKSISRKVTEAFLAQRIEERFSKEKILELYLNRIYFGSGFYGISAAAKGYFGKKAVELTVSESAMLAGVIRNPYYRSPFNFPEAAKSTRNYILTRMVDEGFLEDDQLEDLKNSPLDTAPRGSATGKSKYVYETVRQKVIELIGAEQASRGGFRISTTIDNKVQLEAEESLRSQLDRIEKESGYSHQTREIYKALKKQFYETTTSEDAKPPEPTYLQGAALMIENRTGAIVALVGGRDFNDSMFDRTTMARRPPGTAFKPFVFAAAFETGLFPGTLVEDTEIDNKYVQIGGETGILGEWGVESFDNVYEGEITARAALANSKNAATVRLGIQIGLDKVVALGESAGIEFVGDRRNFNATFLGLSDASMKEMCVAYSIFPNRGGHPGSIHMISEIRDSEGNQIYAPDQEQLSPPAIDPYTAFQVTSCLTDALKYGTGEKAYSQYGLADFPVAGKSGTGYGFTDNWFIGFTSEVTCSVWAGFDQPGKIYQGAFSSDTVLPVWTKMMNQAAHSFPPQKFEPPADAVKVEICSHSGKLATDACYEVDQSGESAKHVRSTYVEYLRPGTEVRAVCPIHGAPGSKPLTPPKFDVTSLTMATPVDTGGALRAQPLVTSDPVIPVAPTVIGEDPYQSLAPKIRAKTLVPDSLKETPGDENSGVDEPEEVAIDEPATNEEGLPIARPISASSPPEKEEEDPKRIKLAPPKPIEFD